MVKNYKFLLFILLLVITTFRLKGQEKSIPLQKYMYGALSCNTLDGVPNDRYCIGTDYGVGLTKYFGRTFIDGSLAVSYTSNKFFGDISLPNGSFIGPITNRNISVVLPLSIGRSFLIYETMQQVDVYAGINAKYKFFSSFSGDTRQALPESDKLPDSSISGFTKGKDANLLSNSLNFGLQIGMRYWIGSEVFLMLEGRGEFLNNLNSDDILIRGYKDSRSPMDYSSRNLSIALGVGYSF